MEIYLKKDKKIGKCALLDDNKIQKMLNVGYDNLEKELELFIENILIMLKKEKGLVTGKIPIPKR